MTDREANLTVLQECMATILADHTNKPDVIVLLTSLVGPVCIIRSFFLLKQYMIILSLFIHMSIAWKPSTIYSIMQ